MPWKNPATLALSADGTAIAHAVLTPHAPQVRLGYWDEADGPRVLATPTLPSNVLQLTLSNVGISGDGDRVVARFDWTFSPSGSPSDALEYGSESILWDEERGLIDLEVLLASLGVDLEGWTIERLADISDDGRAIVGTAYHAGEDRTEAFLAIIPEPSTAVLLGLGLMIGAGRGAGRSRRRPGT